MLKSKLKCVTVTAADTEYEGSLTLDRDLMDAANLIAGEKVEVNAKNGTSRIETYVIPGGRGSGKVEINGGAANFFKVGDKIHVNCFVFVKRDENNHEMIYPTVVFTDKNNKVINA